MGTPGTGGNKNMPNPITQSKRVMVAKLISLAVKVFNKCDSKTIVNCAPNTVKKKKARDQYMAVTSMAVRGCQDCNSLITAKASVVQQLEVL
mmetsp:Transcript_12994/g.19117  ORF Transcript_12994/g.19117 Transcript_12994/m.19117 type:complete len:92 (-) Transcript_12994:825-1100(-)